MIEINLKRRIRVQLKFLLTERKDSLKFDRKVELEFKRSDRNYLEL